MVTIIFIPLSNASVFIFLVVAEACSYLRSKWLNTKLVKRKKKKKEVASIDDFVKRVRES